MESSAKVSELTATFSSVRMIRRCRAVSILRAMLTQNSDERIMAAFLRQDSVLQRIEYGDNKMNMINFYKT